jgi:transcriptional regulator
MLKEYFIQILKLRSPKPLTNQDILRFLKEMDATIKSVSRIVEQKIQEYLK